MALTIEELNEILADEFQSGFNNILTSSSSEGIETEVKEETVC